MNHEFKKLEQNRIRGACLYLFSLDPLKLFQRWSIYVVLSSFSQVGALLVWYWSLENFISSKHDIQFITFGWSWCFGYACHISTPPIHLNGDPVLLKIPQTTQKWHLCREQICITQWYWSHQCWHHHHHPRQSWEWNLQSSC